MRKPILAVAALLTVAAPSSALGLVEVGALGNVSVDALQVLIDEDAGRSTITLRLRVSGRAQTAAAVVALPAGAQIEKAPSPAVLDRLRAQTLPRLVEVEARDPCAKGAKAQTTEWIAPSPVRGLDKGWRPRAIAIKALIKPDPAERFGLSSTQVARLRRTVGPEGKVLVLAGKLGRSKGAWLPPMQYAVDGPPPPLELGPLADRTPAGRVQKVTIITRSDRALLTVPGVHTPLAPVAFFPETGLEDPLDLQQAVRHHAARRHGDGTVVVEYAAERGAPPMKVVGLARFYFEQSPRTARAPIQVAPAAKVEPLEPRWTFRRVWRRKLACAPQDFTLNVQHQQRSDLKTYAVATGRPIREITAQLVERGYAIRADGSLARKIPPRSKRLRRAAP